MKLPKEISDRFDSKFGKKQAKELADNLEIAYGKRGCPICGIEPEKQLEFIKAFLSKELDNQKKEIIEKFKVELAGVLIVAKDHLNKEHRLEFLLNRIDDIIQTIK